MKTQHNNKNSLTRFVPTLALGMLIIGATAAYAPAPQPEIDGLVSDVLANEHPGQPVQNTAQQTQAPAATAQTPVVIPLSQTRPIARVAQPIVIQPAPQAAAQVVEVPPAKPVHRATAVAVPAPAATAEATTAASITRSGEVRPDQGTEMAAAPASAMGMPAHRWLNAFNAMVVIALVLLAILNYWLWSSARKLSDAASEQLLTAKKALEDVQTVAGAGEKPEKIEKPARAKKAAGMKMESGKENAA